MAKYIKCSRCELNYILEGEELCDVCKAELGIDNKITLLYDIMDEEDQVRLCPVCKANTIGLDEEMCEHCLTARDAELAHTEDNDEWRTYIDDDAEDLDEEVDIPLEELEEDDFEENLFEDEENSDTDHYDDFDISDDYVDDEDEEEDEDDDF